jgi:hypothetical protein
LVCPRRRPSRGHGPPQAKAIAEAGINIDMIVQNVSARGGGVALRPQVVLVDVRQLRREQGVTLEPTSDYVGAEDPQRVAEDPRPARPEGLRGLYPRKPGASCANSAAASGAPASSPKPSTPCKSLYRFLLYCFVPEVFLAVLLSP